MSAFVGILDPASAVCNVDAPPDCFSDLHLDQIVGSVVHGNERDQLSRYFYAPPYQVSTIQYRQQIFRDLEDDQNRQQIQEFVDSMHAMHQRLHLAATVWHPLQQHGWFSYAIENYCAAVVKLRDDLIRHRPNSPGLRAFAGHVFRYAGSDTFTTLAAETADLQRDLHQIRYTVHIQGLRVHVEKFDGQADYSARIASTFDRFASESVRDYHVALPEFNDMNHVEEQILECVAKLHPEPFARLKDFCHRHEHFIEPVIARFEREIPFYLSYLAFMRRITTSRLKFCYPEVSAEPGICVEQAFDLALAINPGNDDAAVVANDFMLAGDERVLVVTGPNQGGKTTFARTIGQCAYLASLGCPVPAHRARLTLPDHIFTHFERQEDLGTLHGKLDNELVRIHDILARATEHSLIIMNESFSSTTVHDALVIGTEVLQRIIQIGCMAVYFTFLDEFASYADGCVSMVGEVAPDDPTRRLFTFTRRPADGLAYAAALADKYGLGRDTLRDRISE